jgi:ribonuclease HII
MDDAAPPDRPVPDLRVEGDLLARGHHLVAGLDEVGRGAWAGPVLVGVVVIDDSTNPVPEGTRDSKMMTPKARAALRPALAEWCVAWSLGSASAAEIDRCGLMGALRLAARRALHSLPRRPGAIVIDGPHDFLFDPVNFDPASPPSRRTLAWRPEVVPLVKADAHCGTVAAASVLAKVARDDLMTLLSRRHPDYGFAQHKGYGTSQHADAIAAHGLTSSHRSSWSFALPTPAE